jgi:hypothetical protein
VYKQKPTVTVPALRSGTIAQTSPPTARTSAPQIEAGVSAQGPVDVLVAKCAQRAIACRRRTTGAIVNGSAAAS